jgi:hypothetical protein
VLTESELQVLTRRTNGLHPAGTVYVDTELLPCLFTTVIDFQMRTIVVERALSNFDDHHGSSIRTLDDLESVFRGRRDDRKTNTKIAEDLWGYRLWVRVGLLRAMVAWMKRIGIDDLAGLRDWAQCSDFKRDFEGKVRYRAEGRTYGLGLAVYSSLGMRLGVETIKPDTRLRKFVQASIGRRVTDTELVTGLIEVARRNGISPRSLDLAIWESEG